jgi:hypothetical protein
MISKDGAAGVLARRTPHSATHSRLLLSSNFQRIRINR